MRGFFYTCECGCSFQVSAPRCDGEYPIHCPACIRLISGITVFDNGKDYERIKGMGVELVPCHLIELTGDEFLRQYKSSYGVWHSESVQLADATHFSAMEPLHLSVSDDVELDGEIDDEVVAIYDAFVAPSMLNNSLEPEEDTERPGAVEWICEAVPDLPAK